MKIIEPSEEAKQFIKNEFEYINGELFRKPFTYTTGNRGSRRQYPRTLLNNSAVNSGGYIMIRFTLNGKTHSRKIHQIIWFLYYGVWPISELDHVDNNKLNNNISNLRLATRAQNNTNKPKYKTKQPKSRFKGVAPTYNPNGKPWMAYIQDQGKQIYLGVFWTDIEAAHAYDKAAIKYHGDFTYLNFPMTLLLLRLSELSLLLC